MLTLMPMPHRRRGICPARFHRAAPISARAHDHGGRGGQKPV